MKIKFDEKILILIFLIISILIIFIISYLIESYNMQYISQGFYSSNTIFFKTDSNNKLNIDTIKKDLKNGILFKELDLNYDIRAIIFSKKTNMPSMKEGRYFKEEDFENDNKLAVIGVDFNQDFIIQEDNKRFVMYQNEKYEIIGIMGYKEVSKIDRACFITLNDELLQSPGTFAIDSNNYKNVSNFYEKIQPFFEDCVQINKETNSVNRFFKVEGFNIFMFIILIMLFLLTTVSVSLYWVRKRKREIAVLRLLGYSDKRITKTILFRYLNLTHISVFIGFIIGIIGVRIAGYTISLLIIIISYFVMLLCCIIAAVVPIHQALEINLSSQLGCKL